MSLIKILNRLGKRKNALGTFCTVNMNNSLFANCEILCHMLINPKSAKQRKKGARYFVRNEHKQISIKKL